MSEEASFLVIAILTAVNLVWNVIDSQVQARRSREMAELGAKLNRLAMKTGNTVARLESACGYLDTMTSKFQRFNVKYSGRGVRGEDLDDVIGVLGVEMVRLGDVVRNVDDGRHNVVYSDFRNSYNSGLELIPISRDLNDEAIDRSGWVDNSTVVALKTRNVYMAIFALMDEAAGS